MKLLEILKERNISRLQLAMSTKVNPSSIYDATNKRIPFYPAWKKRIAEYLELTEEELFSEDETEQPEYSYTFKLKERITCCYDCPICDNEQAYCCITNKECQDKDLPQDCPLTET
jgi:transcriptional regulator with XRE-family HTH domain